VKVRNVTGSVEDRWEGKSERKGMDERRRRRSRSAMIEGLKVVKEEAPVEPKIREEE
jgi:hypothetical protein